MFIEGYKCEILPYRIMKYSLLALNSKGLSVARLKSECKITSVRVRQAFTKSFTMQENSSRALQYDSLSSLEQFLKQWYVLSYYNRKRSN